MSAAKQNQTITSVEEYIASIPKQTRPLFDQLRQLVVHQLPDYKEVYSFGILGYSIDNNRPRVFISGWQNHLAIYPVPKDPVLQKELAPYIRGKGTLWFGLDQTLPVELIIKVVNY